MGKMRLLFIDSDLLYRGAFSGRFDWICFVCFWNLQFLTNVIIIKTKVLLPQVTL
jgi:hypothetical protein